MGHDMKRAGNGERAGRQEVQHTHESAAALEFLAAKMDTENRSKVVQVVLVERAKKAGWRPKS